MIQESIHTNICKNFHAVSDWFKVKRQDLQFPVYSSYDFRDSGLKIAPVDANIFPAGFNNICQVDRDNAPEIFKNYINKHYNLKSDTLVLVTEEHTANAYYLENVYAIKQIMENSGFKVLVTFPNEMPELLELESINGHKITIHPSSFNAEGQIIVDGQSAELIICNNDFSSVNAEWVGINKTPMNPPFQLGWHSRRKHEFFGYYNELVKEFSQIIEMDPFAMQVVTEKFTAFDINSDEHKEILAKEVDRVLEDLRDKYKTQGLAQEPFVFIKNNSGTYGLGILKVSSGDEVRSWSYKLRKKMKAVKGGGFINEVIIQEGIPTRYFDNNEAAEPSIYMIGTNLAGGFLRTHSKKGPQENLNSPGAIYKRLCVSDLEVNISGCPMENVYGWLAKIGLLAIALEAREHQIRFSAYQK